MIDAGIHMPGEFVCTKFLGLIFGRLERRQRYRLVIVTHHPTAPVIPEVEALRRDYRGPSTKR
jgi:hypothetical protein